MPATASPPRRPGGPAAPAASSRTTLLAAAVAAVAAAGLGFVALGSGSGSGQTAADTAKVVVAEKPIPRGTPLKGLPDGTLEVRTVAESKVTPGALVSLDATAGKVAASDLAPGAQVTARNLVADDGAVAARLPKGQRAVTLPVDAAHGMAGEITSSDRVDVYGSYQVTQKDQSQARPVLKLIAQNVRVLRAPAAGTQNAAAASAEVTLALDPATAAHAAFTADNGKLWVAARPAGSSERVEPSLVTVESLLFGVEPIVSAESTPVNTKESAR